MCLFSLPFFLGRLAVALLLMLSIAAGYLMLASLCLLPFLYAAPLVFTGLFSCVAAIGLHFATQVSSIILHQPVRSLSSMGYELYSQQRGATVIGCVSLSYLSALFFLLTDVETPLIFAGAGLMSLATVQLASLLSRGKIFELSHSFDEETEARVFSLSVFVQRNIFCYASGDYLNAWGTVGLLGLVAPLYTLPLDALSQLPPLALSMTLFEHYLLSWVWGARWALALLVALPAIAYVWCYHPWAWRARWLLDWLAPSFLAVLVFCSLGLWAHDHFLSPSALLATMPEKNLWGASLLGAALAMCVMAIIRHRFARAQIIAEVPVTQPSVI